MFRKEDRKRNIQSITIGTPGFENLSKYGSGTGWTENFFGCAMREVSIRLPWVLGSISQSVSF